MALSVSSRKDQATGDQFSKLGTFHIPMSQEMIQIFDQDKRTSNSPIAASTELDIYLENSEIDRPNEIYA